MGKCLSFPSDVWISMFFSSIDDLSHNERDLYAKDHSIDVLLVLQVLIAVES
jgi:hypothetical protein